MCQLSNLNGYSTNRSINLVHDRAVTLPAQFHIIIILSLQILEIIKKIIDLIQYKQRSISRVFITLNVRHICMVLLFIFFLGSVEKRDIRLVACSTRCKHARCYVTAPRRPAPIVTFVKVSKSAFTKVTIGAGRRGALT